MRIEDTVLIVFFALCIFAFGFLFGHSRGIIQGIYATKEEAVDVNAGYYEADPETGTVSFKWKICK